MTTDDGVKINECEMMLKCEVAICASGLVSTKFSVLSNSFSAEYGWTAGPALNIVIKSGTNNVRGDGLFMTRPGAWQAKTFGTDGFTVRRYPPVL